MFVSISCILLWVGRNSSPSVITLNLKTRPKSSGIMYLLPSIQVSTHSRCIRKSQVDETRLRYWMFFWELKDRWRPIQGMIMFVVSHWLFASRDSRGKTVHFSDTWAGRPYGEGWQLPPLTRFWGGNKFFLPPALTVVRKVWSRLKAWICF